MYNNQNSLSTYNDTTLDNLSQDFFYNLSIEHDLKPLSIRALAAFCVVAIGANQKAFVTSTSGRALAPYSGLSQQYTDIGMEELVEKGILTRKSTGNGVSCSIYAPSEQVVNYLYLVKLELQSIWISKRDNGSLINNYKDSIFTTWEKSWILSPALATNPGLAKVCAVMAVKGLTGAQAIGKEIGVSARAVRRSLTLLSNMGIADGGKIDKVKEFVYTYLGLEDYLDTEECEEIIKKKESRLKKYKKQIIERAIEAVHIIKFGALALVSKTKALKDLRFSTSWGYKLKDGVVTYIDERTGLILFSCNVYKDIKLYDMTTARRSVDQAKKLDLSILERVA